MAATPGRKNNERVPSGALCDELPLMVWKGAADGLLDYFNDYVHDYSGATHAQLAGSGWLRIVHPDDRQRVLRRWLHSLITGEPYEIEFRIRKRNHSYRWFLAQATAVADEANDPVRWVGTCTDIHGRLSAADTTSAGTAAHVWPLMLTREEIARTGRLATLREATGAFAHELSQPLAASLSNAQALQAMIEHGIKVHPEVQETVSDIVIENKRAVTMLRALRAAASCDSIHARSRDLNALVREVAALLYADLIANRCALELECARGLPPVRVDSLQMQYVLMMLVMNACEAMKGTPPEGRRITIRTGTAGLFVGLEVEDCGPGVQGDMERIFEPFYSTKAHAAGLGLTVCRSIVEAHGGRIQLLRDRTHEGATFRIELPVARAKAPS